MNHDTQPKNVIDMSNRRVGDWHVLDYAGSHHRRATWYCRHVCGAEKKISGHDLRRAGPVLRLALTCRECGE